MPIHFDGERMQKAIEAHRLWWCGELGRPLVMVTVHDAYDVPHTSQAPFPTQATCNDFSISPEQIIDTIDESLRRQEYLGDAYPCMDLCCFGPSTLAAFCGARLDNSTGTAWFLPEKECEIQELHIKYDRDNLWTKRIKAVCRAGQEKWNGGVIISMPDFGGVLDIAASFRGSENLMYDLVDEPDEVLRVCGEIQTAWFEAYADFHALLNKQPAQTNWIGLLSADTGAVIQCDFCYMLGNPMFKQFVLDTLVRDTEHFSETIYHLDGIGELNHLDDMLAIPKLTAVQWVPGAGQPGPAGWLDVYRKIISAGKQIMVVDKPSDYLGVMSELHCRPYYWCGLKKDQAELAKAVLAAR